VLLEPTLEIRRVRLDDASRPAVGVPLEMEFDAKFNSSGQQLRFSVGTQFDPQEGARKPVRFVVEIRNSQGWLPIFEEVVPGATSQWFDREVDLPAAAGPLHLRFKTRRVAAVDPKNRATDASTDGSAYWGAVSVVDAEADERPNIILISLDTLGAAYLERYGGEPGTSPEIDRFLANSFEFSRGFSQYGATLPAHSSLFTALYPVHHGRYTMPLPAMESLVRHFARAGWFTLAYTENANVSSVFGFDDGFDHWDDGHAHGFDAFKNHGNLTTNRTIDWLDREGRSMRFFLFLHTYEVHSPYIPAAGEPLQLANRITPNDKRVFDRDPRKMASALLNHTNGSRPLSKRDIARFRALHIGEIRSADQLLAKVLSKLEQLELDRDTLVIVTSDHGDQFGEQGHVGHGNSIHNKLLHVPLAFRWPGRIEKGSYDAPVELVDLIPTVLELTGQRIPEGLNGRSLVGIIAGTEISDGTEAAFSEQQYDSVECARWKGPGPCRIGRYSVQTRRFKYVSSEIPRFERFYDLSADPNEARDVSSQYPAEVARHRALLASNLEKPRVPPTDEAPMLDEEIDDATQHRLRALGYVE